MRINPLNGISIRSAVVWRCSPLCPTYTHTYTQTTLRATSVAMGSRPYLCNTSKNSYKSQPKRYYLILTFRSHHEILIRRSWYSVLPSLDATISCRIKKAVVGVTQLIAALVSIHGSMTFLADMYSFLDPPGTG